MALVEHSGNGAALTIIPESGVDIYRMSTDAATITRALVMATAMEIQGRKYVKAEGWQAIAVAHGCAASACNVERVAGGFRATGQIRRMDTGAVIAEAEGFVGEDEAVWFGGTVTDKWGKTKTHPKRPDFAIRAMAQTRAISRACRSAFAHVVVQIDKNLGTTPAEEMQGVFDHDPEPQPQPHIIGANVPTVDPGDAHLIRGDAIDPETGEVRSQYKVDKAKKEKNAPAEAKKFADNLVSTFKLSGQTVETLTKCWNANARQLDALKERYSEEYKRVEKEYDNAKDAAEARAA